ncbi:hypothetical protein OPT61_g8405 [Boeremia exigua]|uniref:Uncharacterized protein n=1 Tax=Boeremia exigua TaxID=749465 RepID=A0ACC2HYY2_9PLEO|nr:hypothetical protein OPT61_g8405 [Boeremia exigua]
MERYRSWPSGIQECVLRQKTITSEIPVHIEFRRDTHRREGETFVNGIYNETGCIVVAHWDHQVIKRFDVYAGAGSKDAIAAVHKWIARGKEKTKESAAWAKTPAFNHTQWYQEQLDQMEEDRLGFFLGPKPAALEGEHTLPTVIVDWPQDILDYEITPRTAFGNELEALNELRKRDRVHMTLLPNHRVEIIGYDTNSVQAAKNHYGIIIERVRVEKCSLQQPTNIIMDEKEGMKVALVQAEAWWPNRTDMVVPRLLPPELIEMDQPGRFREDGLQETQLKDIQDAIELSLKAVSYRKGSYDFVVRLGCFAFDGQKIKEDQVGKEHPKAKFAKTIKGLVDLKPKNWLLDNALGTQLYHRLTAADDLLEPTKSAGSWGSKPATLGDTRPVLRGTWVFRDPNSTQKPPLPPTRNVGRPVPIQQTPRPVSVNPQDSLFVVQVDWVEDDEGSYEKAQPRFYRLQPGNSGPKKNMEVNLLELGESRTWFFALESMTPVPRFNVHHVLAGFAQRTVLKSDYDENSMQPFAKCESSPTVKNLLLNGRLDKIYNFAVRNTCYKVELTGMLYSARAPLCWGLAVRHTEWATHLAELELLQTGHQAGWGDILETFLPNDGGSSVNLAYDDIDSGSPKPGDNSDVSSLKSNDSPDVGNLKISDDTNTGTHTSGDSAEKEQEPAGEGIRTLTNILLQVSKIVSSVTLGEAVLV